MGRHRPGAFMKTKVRRCLLSVLNLSTASHSGKGREGGGFGGGRGSISSGVADGGRRAGPPHAPATPQCDLTAALIGLC
jgi:hypothetical protein